MICTRLNKLASQQIGSVQNNLYLSKMIWSVQNDFGLVKGQEISRYVENLNMVVLIDIWIPKLFDL